MAHGQELRRLAAHLRCSKAKGFNRRREADGTNALERPSSVSGRGATLRVAGPLVLAAVLIGLNFVAIKVAVESIPPLLVGALRFTLGGLLLLCFLRAMGLGGSRLTRRLFLTTLGIGLVGGTLYNITLNEGTSLTSASSAALIMATAPVWGMLLAAGFGVEPLRATTLIGAGVSLVGVGLILGRGLEGGGSSLVGDLLVFAASVCFGAYAVLSQAQQGRYPPLTIAAYTIFFGGLAIFPFTPVELASWEWGSVSAVSWIAVGYMAFVSTAFGYGVWQWGLSRIGVDQVLVYLNLITLTGVVSSVVILGEGFGITKILGTVVLLAGVYLAHRR
jgi:drug/metabolite transporter (DMT)-like permease